MEEKYGHYNDDTEKKNRLGMNVVFGMIMICLLYTSDAADEL